MRIEGVKDLKLQPILCQTYCETLETWMKEEDFFLRDRRSDKVPRQLSYKPHNAELLEREVKFGKEGGSACNTNLRKKKDLFTSFQRGPAKGFLILQVNHHLRHFWLDVLAVRFRLIY